MLGLFENTSANTFSKTNLQKISKTAHTDICLSCSDIILTKIRKKCSIIEPLDILTIQFKR